MKISSTTVEETRKAGAQLAAQAKPGDVFGLIGDLGAGKTEFVRGFVAALDAEAAVRSPTFTLVNIYETPVFPIYHFDFYRLHNPDELREIGFYEYAAGGGVCLIEWADMFPDVLAENARRIQFFANENGSRTIEMI